MNQQRTVFCKKLKQDLPALPFRPFNNDFGLLLFQEVSLQAWQMWLQESPRFINTYGWDLQSEDGKAELTKQMRIYFGFDDGELLNTAWTPPSAEGGTDGGSSEDGPATT